MQQSHVAVRPRPQALRLVNTQDLSRESWLNVRKQGIGSSDAAAAVGLNPYLSPLELWMIKTGRDKDLPKPDPFDEASPIYWGSLLEPIVARHYTKHTGRKVRRINAVLQHPDPDKSWMLANLDYTVSGSDEVQIVECKTAGFHGTFLWRDGVPEYIQLQVQHQLAVTGKAAADVCVLVCGQEIRIHRIERDDELIAKLVELERQFWRYVESDTPPPADGSESSGKALRYLFPQDAGNTLDLSDDIHLSVAFADLVQVRQEVAAKQEKEEVLKQRIQQRMGDASRAIFATGSVSWKRSKDSLTLDTGKLLKDQPDLLQRYPLTRPGSRRFIINS